MSSPLPSKMLVLPRRTGVAPPHGTRNHERTKQHQSYPDSVGEAGQHSSARHHPRWAPSLDQQTKTMPALCETPHKKFLTHGDHHRAPFLLLRAHTGVRDGAVVVTFFVFLRFRVSCRPMLGCLGASFPPPPLIGLASPPLLGLLVTLDLPSRLQTAGTSNAHTRLGLGFEP